MKSITITVLMPVFNASLHLVQAVKSILDQTYYDLELLVIDDGSTDSSAEILRTFKDDRIRIVRTPNNQGIVAALNLGLGLAKGDFIARMDADDIAEPDRLYNQIDFAKHNPEIGIIGTDFIPFGIGAAASWIRWYEHADIKIALLFENPICHPTVLLRRSVLQNFVYPNDVPHAEEYALWTHLSFCTQFANLRQPLLRYRSHPGQISQKKAEEQIRSIERIIRGQLLNLGLDPSPAELRLHMTLSHGFHPLPGLEVALDSWIEKLEIANQRFAIYDPKRFAVQLHTRRNLSLYKTSDMLKRMSLLRRLRWRLHSFVRQFQ